jgi:hypothetical protein
MIEYFVPPVLSDSPMTALLALMDCNENTSAVTTAVCGMVTDGTWSLLDALYVFAINSTTNAKLNWVSTNHSPTVNGTLTFTPTKATPATDRPAI